LKRDDILINTLSQYSSKKVIFTNADNGHACRVLSNLGVENFFDKVIDIQAIHPYCKPMKEAFQLALISVGVKNVANCVMIDDSDRNLQTAHDLGFFTIQVGTVERSPYVDAAIANIKLLLEVIPVSTSFS
jgi:putative hydrolase of the HAD superfamily